MEPTKYWQDLQPRERWVVGVGVGIVVLGLGYAYLWQPMVRERQRLQDTLPGLRLQAAQLAAARDEAIGLKRQGAPAAARANLRQVLEDSAAALDLRRHIERIDVAGEARATLSMGEVPFDAWVRWLKALQTSQGIRVEACAVEAAGPSGQVRVRATVLRE